MPSRDRQQLCVDMHQIMTIRIHLSHSICRWRRAGRSHVAWPIDFVSVISTLLSPSVCSLLLHFSNTMPAPTPLSEGTQSLPCPESTTRLHTDGVDAIGRFRIIHPDKDSRPLARRLHRYAAATSSDAVSADLDHEREMIRLEAMKWKLGVERVLGSVKNLERQRGTYQARAEETGMSV